MSEKKNINYNALAKKLYSNHYKSKNLVYEKPAIERHGYGTYYKYENGVFDVEDIDNLHEALIEDLSLNTPSTRTSVLSNLSIMAGKKMRKDKVQFNPKAKEYINVKNGMVELKTGKLLPHSQEYYSTIQLDFEFDDMATCPQFDEALKVLTLDDDAMIDLIQEWMGYLLVPTTQMQQMLIMKGGGSNMKSTLIEVMQWLVGEANYGVFSLGQLNDKNNLFDLRRKLVNFADEEESRAVNKVVDTQTLKKMIGGGTVTGTEKFKQSIQFVSSLRLVLACNDLPLVTDTTYAWERRLCILPFDYKIEPEDKIPDYAETRLKPELSGIFNFALEGYQRLMRTQKFTECFRAQETLRQHIQENNAPATFMLERYTNDPMPLVLYADAFAEYKDWCGTNKYNACGIKVFGSRVRNYFENRDDLPLQVEKERGTGNQVIFRFTRAVAPEEEVETIAAEELETLFD